MKAEHNKKVTIGLTGGIGSGKSLISSLFSSLGIPSYNSDKEAKNLYLLDHVKELVIHSFGNDIYTHDKLDTKALADIVFSNKTKLEKLNSIIHPEVGKHFESWRKSQTSKYIIKESAILIETKIYKSCDYVISVSCPENIRITRVLERDNVSEIQVKERIDKQISDSERNKFANWIIDNSGNKSVIRQVHKIYEELLIL